MSESRPVGFREDPRIGSPMKRTERDELRGTLSNTICNASFYPKRAQPYLLGGDMSDVLDRTADALLAAGYRKPQQVTTVEELDGLPYGSIVIFDEGWRTSVAERQAESMRWYVPGCLDYIRPEALLPATVMHVGGAL